jgi:hypothetical protein
MDIGDIPSGTWRGEVLTAAALASNGASNALGIGTDAQRFRLPQDGVIVGVAFEPTGANQVASSSLSYRNYVVYNGSTDGAGTVVLGSLSMSTSVASNVRRAFTLQTATASLTADANDIIAISQTTVGGDETDGTVVVAGAFHINWRPL